MKFLLTVVAALLGGSLVSAQWGPSAFYQQNYSFQFRSNYADYSPYGQYNYRPYLADPGFYGRVAPSYPYSAYGFGNRQSGFGLNLSIYPRYRPYPFYAPTPWGFR